MRSCLRTPHNACQVTVPPATVQSCIHGSLEKSSQSRFIPRQRDDRPSCPFHQCVVSFMALMAPRRTHTATPWAKTRPHRSLHYRARWRCGGRPSLVKTPRFPTSLAVFFTLVVKHFKSRPYHLLTPLLLETLFLKTSHCIS